MAYDKLESMLSVDVGGCRFQLRAAAVVVEEGYVLLHRLAGNPIWALPGGRVEAGEPAMRTVVREILEETGENVECAELLFIAENFFNYDAKSYHEVGLYFRVALPPESPLHNKHVSHKGIEADQELEFCWFLLSELRNLDLKPEFLRAALGSHQVGIAHIVTGK